jgi:hypothetical protein
VCWLGNCRTPDWTQRADMCQVNRVIEDGSRFDLVGGGGVKVVKKSAMFHSPLAKVGRNRRSSCGLGHNGIARPWP